MSKRSLVEDVVSGARAKTARKRSSVLSITLKKSRTIQDVDVSAIERGGDSFIKDQKDSRSSKVAPTQIQVPDFRELLKCVICKQLLVSRIHLCNKGHSLCSQCKLIVPKCPECGEKIEYGRNLLLERIVRKLELPCKYASYGCEVLLLHSERHEHESEECKFKPYSCMNCDADIQEEEIEDHYARCWPVILLSKYDVAPLQDDHNKKATKIFSEIACCDIKSGAVNFFGLVNVHSVGIFTRHVVKKENMWFIWYSVAKSVKKAANFYYHLSVSDSDKRVSFTYSGPVFSLHLSAVDIINKGLCFSLGEKTVSQVTNTDGEFLLHTDMVFLREQTK